MSSVGQAVGYVAGGVVGTFFGNPIIGAQIGGMIGGYIDPPKGQSTVGPRLEDLTVQTSTYGAVIPRVKGTISVTGNVFWLEGNKYKEHPHKTKSGGKGGGSKATNTTFSYSATFGVSLAHCINEPVVGIRRLWLANRLVYDAGSSDVSSIIASNLQDNVVFKLYDGRDDQEPDPRMQADKGAANVSGYPGRCWIAIYDLDLTEHYSNALMATQVTVELVCEVAGDGVAVTPLVKLSADTAGTVTRLNNAIFSGADIAYSVFQRDPWNGNVTDVFFYRAIFGESERLTQSVATGLGPTTICRSIPVCQSSSVVALLQTTPSSPYDTYSVLSCWNDDGSSISSVTLPVATFNIYKDKTACIDGDDWFIASREGLPVHKFTSANLVNQTASSYSILSLGFSETYLFALKFENTTTTSITIYKFDRSTLALVDTWIVAGNANHAELHVINDSEVYVAVDGGNVVKVTNGALSDNLGAVIPTTFNDEANVLPGWFHVISEAPPYVLSTSNYAALDDFVYAGHPHYSAAPAKLHDIITDECALAGIDSSDLDLTELTNHDVRGYKIATLGSARSALEPLQAAFPFDVIQSGYKIKFKDRGTASVLTIPEADLGAHASGDSLAALLPDAIEMPSQISSKVAIQFYNAARDYDIDEQASSNRAGDSKQSRTINLPIVFTPDEALQAADVLLKKEWAERRTFGPFTLPPTDDYRKLEAADVVTVQYKGRDIGMRITKATDLPNGLKECEGKLTSSAAYSSSAVAQAPLVLGQSLVPLRGTTQAVLLDIPRIDAAQDVTGLSVVMYGQASGWPGGVLVSSSDSGGTWDSVIAANTKASVFTAGSPLATHHSYSPDCGGELIVTPIVSGDDLFSVTEDQFYSQSNLAAYGADGRWEIIAFRTAIDNSGTFTLRGFLRGLYGSEWASGLHAAGDLLVMLNASSAGFFGLPTSAIGSPRLYRAVTQGSSLDSAADISDTYDAINLKPLAPVDCAGWRNPSSFDWTIIAQRRTRRPVEVFSGYDVPLGETVESYDLELWNSTFTTKLRTFSGLSSAQATWTGAQQTADAGSTNQATIYFRWYQVSSIVGRGFVYQGSITRFIKVDGSGYAPAILALSPLLYYKMDGNTTTITDSGSAASNATASASNVTYQQPALLTGATPGYAIRFTTGYISAPHVASMNGGYTLVFPYKIEALPGAESGFLGKGDAASGGNQGHYYSIMPDGKLKVVWFNGSWQSQTTTAVFFTAGTKALVSIKYDGATTLKVYKDGSLIQTFTLASAFVSNAQAFIINGSKSTSINGFSANSVIDDFAWFASQLSDTQIASLYEVY